jgi:AraC-like DNA-binding protein
MRNTSIQPANQQQIPVQLEDVVRYIDKNIDKKITIDELSALTSWKREHFSRVFKSFYNQTIYQYILHVKIETIKKEILKTEVELSTIYKKYGFDSYSNFYNAFKKQTLYSPNKYRFYYKKYILEEELTK